jgi:hypothetical protein
MSAPRKIYAWRYHPDNSQPRARGAWDTRTSLKTRNDVDYVRADLAGALRSALRQIVDLGGAHGSADYARRADQIARKALERFDGEEYLSMLDRVKKEPEK